MAGISPNDFRSVWRNQLWLALVCMLNSIATLLLAISVLVSS